MRFLSSQIIEMFFFLKGGSKTANINTSYTPLLLVLKVYHESTFCGIDVLIYITGEMVAGMVVGTVVGVVVLT